MRIWLVMAVGALLTTASVQAQDVQGITPTTIRIGIIGPFSGPATDFSRTQITHQAYYKDINAHGGINGRQLELFIEDDG